MKRLRGMELVSIIDHSLQGSKSDMVKSLIRTVHVCIQNSERAFKCTHNKIQNSLLPGLQEPT